MHLLNEDIVRLLLATLLGGVVGAEREYYNKSAGLRTIILICVGSCLFTILSEKIGGAHDPGRIAANILTGVGFLGAGAIFREENRVKGLTTAATIWLSSAVGLGVGSGYYLLTTFATALLLTVLVVFKRLQSLIDRADEIRDYQLAGMYTPQTMQLIAEAFAQHGLKARITSQQRAGDTFAGVWNARGKRKDHARLVEALLHHPALTGFGY